MRILIDDMRDSLEVDLIIRTPVVAVALIDSWLASVVPTIDMLYLDHDLGDSEDFNGYKILSYMVEEAKILPLKVKVVSSNPVGRDSIYRLLKTAGYTCNYTSQAWELIL